ncbi:carbamoyl-phosphate synthase (glutamine-hydrolyzing) large subunit [Caldalkalibacillus salinus]|uniref:carbamoyl-phosphate synthase (glutamine-hydrolyzing) large subunit n=1 Tax=Caldalkalibacillus salinus TaxID=2803787 RepID=UPI001923A699|nr:carbamoyl-phosphate synthase (glutamine-hydrolyzing) large subunit [Caldalkalibacillus salinus]
MPLHQDIRKVLVIGSGPIQIGQAAEFDYAGTQACLALKEEGIEVVLVNSNPATIMTDPSIADTVYIEPLTEEVVTNIIAKERPDGIIGTLGGQTGLNLTVTLTEKGVLEQYDVALLGTSVSAIKKGEDRELFRSLMLEINEPIPDSAIIESVADGMTFAKTIGFPVVVRPAYTLGGSGGGTAHTAPELETMLYQGLSESPIHQVLLEKSIHGWKEVEYEVMRDDNDTCIIVCNMENIDPVGIHTGDSMVVAPTQTLTDRQVQMLRNASLKIIRSLEVVGGCNIQFALDPYTDQYNVIEVNPRVSRSSALASKATGYPIARMAAKCAIGYHLDEMSNPVTGYTYASYEPAMDYIVVKLPRFPFDKFTDADQTLGTQMQATGEVMAMDRSFEGALNKSLRSLELNIQGLYHPKLADATDETLKKHLITGTADRLFAIGECMRRGVTTGEIEAITQIDHWYVSKIAGLIALEKELKAYTWDTLPTSLLQRAKQMQFSDEMLAMFYQIPEAVIRERRKAEGLAASYKLVDTCAAEFEAQSPYFYSTWLGMDEVEQSDQKKVLVVGSGPIRIGQGIEFDYCSVHAVQALKQQGYEAIVINNNPETVSTDFSTADRLYFEPLSVEDVIAVAEKENVQGVLVQFGGQTALNMAQALKEEGISVLGTPVEAVDALEDRDQFYHLLEELGIPCLQGKTAHTIDEVNAAGNEIGFPMIVRPSYVIGGQSMVIFYDQTELDQYCQEQLAYASPRSWPLLIDPYVPGLECELDAISDGQDVVIPGIFEHMERAGVHSGDSLCTIPPMQLTDELAETLHTYTQRVAQKAGIKGVMNIQFVINDGICYVLEVNPRASRTVPILSKVTNIPVIDWATQVQLGHSIKSLTEAAGIKVGLQSNASFYAVKAPVYSTHKLRGVDPQVGPEMKSTGETLGMGESVPQALLKALGPRWVDQNQEEERWVICSVAEPFKSESVTLMHRLHAQGYKILATEQTYQTLQAEDIPAQRIEKDVTKVEDAFKTKHIQWVVNIPTKGKDHARFGFQLRRLALKYQVPCMTCLDTLSYVSQANASLDQLHWEVTSLQEYRNTLNMIKI